MHVCALLVCVWPPGAWKGHSILRTGGTGGCEPLHGCWEPNTGPLQKGANTWKHWAISPGLPSDFNNLKCFPLESFSKLLPLYFLNIKTILCSFRLCLCVHLHTCMAQHLCWRSEDLVFESWGMNWGHQAWWQTVYWVNHPTDPECWFLL